MGRNKQSPLEKESAKTRSFGLTKSFFFILGLLFLGKILISLLNTYFKVNKIACQQNNQPCTEETLAKLDHLYQKSLFFTDFDKTFSQFENYQIKKHLSGELKVNLSENERNFYQIAENNFITQATEQTLDPKTDEKINLLINMLQDKEIKYQELYFIQNSTLTNENLFIIKLNDDLQALIDPIALEEGVYKLDQILDNLELKEIDLSIKEIDTRFKMPVLKTKQVEL